MPNWDDLNLFLAVARYGRLIAAGRALGVDHTTVARRLGAMEAALGVRLFDRSPRGVSLTAAGQALLPCAERVENEIKGACARLGGQGNGLSGVVRLATPEGFGLHLVAPAMARFHQRHGDLQLELAPGPAPVNLANHEADIAIALNRPPRGRVFARRLVDFRLGLYGAADYLAASAPIGELADLAAHPVIGPAAGGPPAPGEQAALAPLAPQAREVFRSTSLAAAVGAVEAGLGLALLPCYIAEARPALARVLPAVSEQRSYWLVFHADHQHQPRVRAVVDFIDELIEGARARF